MAEYSELIKKFDKIRVYIRDFYVYGFNSREDYKEKSLRTYDNEKRRIESYLKDIMYFRQDANGKTVFISIDNGSITHNPLYKAFKAKTFTKNDISLHFILLDILKVKEELSVAEITDIITSDYLSFFQNPTTLDLSTIRNKLKEYEKLGLIISKKDGKKLLYSLSKDDVIIDDLYDTLTYFSETSPLGVIGSYLLDKIDPKPSYLCFKHHYITHVLDSEITLDIFTAINENRSMEIETFHPRQNKNVVHNILPIKVLISVSGGRRYLCAYNYKQNRYANYRIDYIKTVKFLPTDSNYNVREEEFNEILKHTWGTSYRDGKRLEKVEMVLKISAKENYIIERINREGRHGSLTLLEKDIYKYTIEVYDSQEMLPWIRTFIGRIISFKSTNRETEKIFYKDLNNLYELYLDLDADGAGGDENVI